MKKRNELKHVPPEKGHYIAGFVDGEGSFFLSARKRTDYPAGWKFELHFNVSNRDLAVLEICKKYLGCGKIRESRSGFYTLEVENRQTLATFILPFFQRFSFLSNKKKAEFRLCQKALALMEAEIQTPEQLEEWLRIRKELNELRQTRIKNTDEMIRASFRFRKESSETTR